MHTDLRARRGLRALVLTLSLVLAAGLFAPTAASADAPPSLTSAQLGASWMAGQILVNHGYLMSFGAPDTSDTAYAVIGLHAAGIGGAASREAIAFLQRHLYNALRTGGKDAPGPLSYFIMAAAAAGADPRHFGGSSAVNDLVARLLATQRVTGHDEGLFGTQAPTFDGAFRQGLALAALRAAHVADTDMRVIRGLNWLGKQQCSDGLFEAYRANVSTACGAPDAVHFTGPDTNSAAMALQGLAAWHRMPRRTQALATLHAIEGDDAGFPFIAAAGSSDPNSTALVIQAILALDANPSNLAWHKPGGSPFTALAGFQLGCTDPAAARGAYFFPGSSTPNVFATVQAVPAASRKVLPVGPSTDLGRRGSFPCS